MMHIFEAWVNSVSMIQDDQATRSTLLATRLLLTLLILLLLQLLALCVDQLDLAVDEVQDTWIAFFEDLNDVVSEVKFEIMIILSF